MTEKTREKKEIIETALQESFEKTQPTDEFRQTLLKSGLDISGFQIGESKQTLISGDEYSKNKHEFLEAGLIQSPGESAVKDKENPLRFGRWQHLTAVAGILAIIVLQSAFQFFFVQDENQRVAENIIKNDLPIGETSEKSPEDWRISEPAIPEMKEKAKVETKDNYKKTAAKLTTSPKKSEPKLRRESKINVPRTALRKNDARESNAERLRRAEKILTGI